MDTKISTKQLNVEIKPDVLNLAKSRAYAEGKKLYEWVELAIVEKLSHKGIPTAADQASELRKMMEGRV